MWNILIDLYTMNIRTFLLLKPIFGFHQTERNFYRCTYIEEYHWIMQLFKSISTIIHCQYNKGLERSPYNYFERHSLFIFS